MNVVLVGSPFITSSFDWRAWRSHAAGTCSPLLDDCRLAGGSRRDRPIRQPQDDTFCHPRLAPATIFAKAREQSAAWRSWVGGMLIGLPLGTVPSSFTTPRTLADADPSQGSRLGWASCPPPVRALTGSDQEQ